MEALFELLKRNTEVANALGALASASAAILALAVSGISIYISVWAARIQRKHNELSVRPLAEVTVADYENSIRVKLRNNGSGPMIVTAVTISDGKNANESIVDWMPRLPRNRHWTTFTHALQNRTLQAGGEIALIELTELEGEEGFAVCLRMTRRALSPLTVNVEYTDIYNTVLTPCKKSLSWFGRHENS